MPPVRKMVAPEKVEASEGYLECVVFFFFLRERERKGGERKRDKARELERRRGREEREKGEERGERERERGGRAVGDRDGDGKRRWRRSMSSLVFHASACTANAQILFFSRRSPILNNNPLL